MDNLIAEDVRMVRLTWYDPVQDQNLEIIESLPITIGRDPLNNTVILSSRFISDEHARLDWHDGRILITDLASKNGVFVNGKVIEGTEFLKRGRSFQIGPFSFTCHLDTDYVLAQSEPAIVIPDPIAKPLETPEPEHISGDTALTFSQLTDALTAGEQGQIAPLPALFQLQQIPVEQLSQIAPVETITYLAVGGGIGSFTWVDFLVVSGVKPQEIISIGFEAKPYGRYKRLCENSQIQGESRLRSNSDSCPDNVWGWPGYAVREIARDSVRFRFKKAAHVAWTIFNEPFVQTYTPIAQDVFNAMDREARRIGWHKIWKQGRVRAIRQTGDGRYAVLYSEMRKDQPSQSRIILCDYLHLAVGYPGVRFLPDLQRYRQQTGDFKRVVNAYEDHDWIYEDLKRNGGVLLIRGRGIVASRIIQRLYDLKKTSNAQIGILHLMRTPVSEGNRYKEAQREIDNHWEFQPFNWPKAAWGGDLRNVLERADDENRDQILDEWGGTTTADRRDWRDMIREGLREGWYEIQFGNVEQVLPHESGQIATTIQSTGVVEREVTLLADYIIDATGLDSDIDSSPLLKDLAGHYRLPRNPKRRLAVTKHFELEALQNDRGRAYASGVSTLGGPYAPVDSFLGLQYAALRSVDHLRSQRASGIRRLNGLRSIFQWIRWAIGVKP